MPITKTDILASYNQVYETDNGVAKTYRELSPREILESLIIYMIDNTGGAGGGLTVSQVTSAIEAAENLDQIETILTSLETLLTPTTATVLNQAPLELTLANTVYSVSFTDVLSLEFSARTDVDIRWHYVSGQVETNNYLSLNGGTSKLLDFGQNNKKFTGTLYFLSPTVAGVEIEFSGFF